METTINYIPEMDVQSDLSEKQLGMLEILNDTVNAYAPAPWKLRSVNDEGGCLYKGPNGQRCAFSRLFPEDIVDKMRENTNCFSVINDLKLDLPYSASFYSDLQDLHDTETYWNLDENDSGLSESGIYKYEHIVNLIIYQYF